MKRMTIATVVTLGMLAWTTAPAQQATEVYIPIGESPGVSDKESVIGAISNVEYEQHRMTISTGSTSRTITITPKTLFFLDKSGEKERSIKGDFNDCREGRRVEVYVDDNGVAKWIKIVAT